MALPTSGETNWATPLNDYITNTVLAEAEQADTAITTHLGQTATNGTDPHGLVTYVNGLVTPITNGTNLPNGYVKLDSTGRLPTSITPTGGGITSLIDAVADYQVPAVASGTPGNCSPKIQAALNAAQAAGGAVVYFGTGIYGIGDTLIIPSNTQLVLAPGAVFKRVNSSNGTPSPLMATNVVPSTAGTTAGLGTAWSGATAGAVSSNVLITGGQWIADSVTSAGTNLAFVGASNVTVKDTVLRFMANNAALAFLGCTASQFIDSELQAAAPGAARSSYDGASVPPAVRIECSVTGTVAGLTSANYSSAVFSSAVCSGITVSRINDMAALSSSTDTVSLTGWAYGSTVVAGNNSTQLKFSQVSNWTVNNGIVGSISVVSGKYHTGIVVSDCTALGMPGYGVLANNWTNFAVTGNSLNVTTKTTAVTGGVNGRISGNDPKMPWIDLRPGYTNIVATVAGNYPPQFRVENDRVYVHGSVETETGYTLNGSMFWNYLPSDYCPKTGYLRFTAVGHNSGLRIIQVQTSGQMLLVTEGSGVSEQIYFDFSYPVDGSNSMVES